VIIYEKLMKDHDVMLVLLVEGAKCWKERRWRNYNFCWRLYVSWWSQRL